MISRQGRNRSLSSAAIVLADWSMNIGERRESDRNFYTPHAPTALPPLLHRPPQLTPAYPRLPSAPDRRVGDTTGPTTDLELDRPPRTDPLLDPRSGPEVHRQFRRRVSQRRVRDHSDAVSRPQANGVAERFVRTVR